MHCCQRFYVCQYKYQLELGLFSKHLGKCTELRQHQPAPSPKKILNCVPFLFVFFLSLNLHLEFICFENLQPIVCIAAYVRLVGAVQSFKGDMGTKDFKIGVAVRQGMVPLIAYYVVCDT